jgi:hypothetical protein
MASTARVMSPLQSARSKLVARILFSLIAFLAVRSISRDQPYDFSQSTPQNAIPNGANNMLARTIAIMNAKDPVPEAKTDELQHEIRFRQ